jgi:hypothetical protein
VVDHDREAVEERVSKREAVWLWVGLMVGAGLQVSVAVAVAVWVTGMENVDVPERLTVRACKKWHA